MQLAYRLFILLSFGVVLTTAAQNYITISGIVIDAETNDPLVFVSVGLRGKSIGTISNTIGEFDFHIPSEDMDGTLELNMIGYETFRMPLQRVLNEDITRFALKRNVQVLEEVVINDTLNGGDIYSIALDRIEKNYPMQPFILDAFYRDIKSVGGTYVALLEAAVKIYDRNYDAPRQPTRLREKVGLIEVRKSLGYDNKFTSFFDQTNLLEDILLHNNIRYRQLLMEERFLERLERKEMSFYDGKRVFIVQLKDSEQLTFYIDALTYAFIRVEYSLGPQENVISRRSGLESRTHSLKKLLEFKEYAGKMYLSHIDLVTDVHWNDARSGELKFTTRLHQQLLVNRIQANTSEDITFLEPMKRYGLQYQHREYNKEFWDDYNVIKETPLNRQIVEDLEQEVALELQFRDN